MHSQHLEFVREAPFDVGLDTETENEDDKIFLGFQRPDITDHQLKRFFEMSFLIMFLSRNSVKYN